MFCYLASQVFLAFSVFFPRRHGANEKSVNSDGFLANVESFHLHVVLGSLRPRLFCCFLAQARCQPSHPRRLLLPTWNRRASMLCQPQASYSCYFCCSVLSRRRGASEKFVTSDGFFANVETLCVKPGANGKGVLDYGGMGQGQLQWYALNVSTLPLASRLNLSFSCRIELSLLRFRGICGLRQHWAGPVALACPQRN